MTLEIIRPVSRKLFSFPLQEVAPQEICVVSTFAELEGRLVAVCLSTQSEDLRLRRFHVGEARLHFSPLALPEGAGMLTRLLQSGSVSVYRSTLVSVVLENMGKRVARVFGRGEVEVL